MRTANLFFATLFLVSISLSSRAQAVDFFSTVFYAPFAIANYSDCAAILYKGNLLVNEYSPEGKCKVEMGMEGTLTVATVQLSGAGGTPVKTIGFKVAIKNDRTNTLWMYSEKTLREVPLEDILKKCEKGDRIIFMTVDQRYSLPHHEIELIWGC